MIGLSCLSASNATFDALTGFPCSRDAKALQEKAAKKAAASAAGGVDAAKAKPSKQ